MVLMDGMEAAADAPGEGRNELWFHGSPLRLSVLAAGSTITCRQELAEAFAHKPQTLWCEDDGSIWQNGTQDGWLYRVDAPLEPGKDIYPHPQTSMDPGLEWLTCRPLPLTCVKPLPYLDWYLRDPCRASALPYWKLRAGAYPTGVSVLHSRELALRGLSPAGAELYFRLIHRLNQVPRAEVPAGCRLEALPMPGYAQELAAMLNAAYPDLQMSREEVLAWTRRPVYAPELWLGLRDTVSGQLLASGIAEYDAEAREGVLDWVQVLPQARGRGLGKAIVILLLNQLEGRADFVTVSGKLPEAEAVYRACGFEGKDRWYVFR